MGKRTLNSGSRPSSPSAVPGSFAFLRDAAAIPYDGADGTTVLLTADFSAENLSLLRARFGGQVAIGSATRPEILAELSERFRGHLLDCATHTLVRTHPELSASRVITRGQVTAATILAALFGAGAWLAPVLCGAIFGLALVLGFLSNAVFRAVLVWVGAGSAQVPLHSKVCANEPLPRYSVLVPLYREAEMVPQLEAAMGALDYPNELLEIVFVVEADDIETRAALARQPLDARFSVVAVPPGLPRTKPRAANFGLQLVSGEFTVIYDAEDRPEPDQLRKAVAAFRASPAEVACLQARLNFFNARECWLTKMFALDYGLWFDLLLPGLDRLHVPMPLGGTSNHFRTAALRAIAGWDPYNVTEDADLGIRLARLGMRVKTLDSTTYEEAPIELDNWIRQRSRWMKGYMQTWLVHMRHPLSLVRRSGILGFLGLQLFVGGTVLTALLNPVLWGICLASEAFGSLPGTGFLGGALGHAPAFGLLAGNALFTYLAMLGPYRRGWLEIAPYGLTAPIYWLLISIASYRGLYQLMRMPWNWDKTAHGRSRFAFLAEDQAP